MTIEKHASKLLAIFPEEARNDLILGGGCLRAYYDGTPIKDIDVWFRSPAAYFRVIEVLATTEGWKLEDSPRGCANFRSPCGQLVNLVGFHFGEAIDLLGRFDFRCCAIVAVQNYEFGAVVAHHPEALADAENKLLYVLNNNGTERTLRRIEHYIQDYGYELHPDQEVEQDDLFGHAPQGVSEPPPVPRDDDYHAKARRRLAAIPVSRFDYT